VEQVGIDPQGALTLPNTLTVTSTFAPFGCLSSLPSLLRFKSRGKYGLALRNFTVIHYRLVPPTRSEVILFNVVLELLSPVGLFLWMGGKQPASWYPFGISPIARHSLSFTIKPVNILLGKCT
jgi:hypothetical protein